MLSELRLAGRTLARSPGFTLVMVLTLALGIGANTAIVSIVHGVLLKPLPYPDDERLLVVNEASEHSTQMPVSFPNFVDWRSQQRTFSAIGVVRTQAFNDVSPAGVQRIAGAQATHEVFAALAVPPVRGRWFNSADDRLGAEKTVLIRESFWHRRLGGRDTAIGETIQLTGQTYTVIGVLPDTFHYPSRQTEVWEPLGLYLDQPAYQNRGNRGGLQAMGRLKPGVTIEAARADLREIAARLAREYPGSNHALSISMEPLRERLLGQTRPMLHALAGAAAFVLLIACANVANLQLARAHARRREFVVRAALGATRGQVVRQILAESVLVGVCGCAAGVLLGSWTLGLLRGVVPMDIPRLPDATLEPGVLVFTATVGLLITASFALVPALHAAGKDLHAGLACGARQLGAARGTAWRSGLIVIEFALTCVLLVGAGLMIRTLAGLYRSDPGFSTRNVVTFTWALPGTTTHSDPAKRVAVVERALSRLAAVPGVEKASIISPLPLAAIGNSGAYYVEGMSLDRVEREIGQVERAHISSDYFATLSIPLLAGRSFDARDVAGAPKVAIIDAAFVAKHFPHESPLGKRFTYGSTPPKQPGDWYHIVGVVAHVQNTAPGKPTRLQSYVPYTQLPPVAMTFALRTDRASEVMIPAARAIMREIAPELPISSESTMAAVFDASIATQRLAVHLLGAFATLAVGLATVGLFGVISYQATQRTGEMAVRVALGASPSSLTRLVLGEGLQLAGAGLLLGLLSAFGLTRSLSSLLYNVSPLDPWSFGAVAVLLGGVGLSAAWLPARRVARVNPVAALRGE